MAEPEIEIPTAAYGVAFPLAWVGGYVDAVGFLTLAGLCVAHMSGNTIRLGVSVTNVMWTGTPATRRSAAFCNPIESTATAPST